MTNGIKALDKTKQSGKVLGKASRMAGRVVSVVDLVGLVREILETYRSVEEERTKRARIAAQLQSALAEIAARKTLMHQYLARRFAERSQIVDICRDIITNTQDRDLVLQAMETLQVIVTTSPFDNLTSMFSSTGAQDR